MSNTDKRKMVFHQKFQRRMAPSNLTVDRWRLSVSLPAGRQGRQVFHPVGWPAGRLAERGVRLRMTKRDVKCILFTFLKVWKMGPPTLVWQRIWKEELLNIMREEQSPSSIKFHIRFIIMKLIWIRQPQGRERLSWSRAVMKKKSCLNACLERKTQKILPVSDGCLEHLKLQRRMAPSSIG